MKTYVIIFGLAILAVISRRNDTIMKVELGRAVIISGVMPCRYYP